LYRRRVVCEAISFGAKILYVKNHELISVSGLNRSRCQYSIDDHCVMTQRHAKVLTVHRRCVKKPILLISGCEMLSRKNVILTLFSKRNTLKRGRPREL
jgi:hypothetical protein